MLYKNATCTLASCLTFSLIRIMVDWRVNSVEDISIPKKVTNDAQALCPFSETVHAGCLRQGRVALSHEPVRERRGRYDQTTDPSLISQNEIEESLSVIKYIVHSAWQLSVRYRSMYAALHYAARQVAIIRTHIINHSPHHPTHPRRAQLQHLALSV